MKTFVRSVAVGGKAVLCRSAVAMAVKIAVGHMSVACADALSLFQSVVCRIMFDHVRNALQ